MATNADPTSFLTDFSMAERRRAHPAPRALAAEEAL